MRNYNFTVTKIYGLVERQAPPDWSLKAVRHGNSYRLSLILNGNGWFVYNGQTVKMKKDEIFLFPHNIYRDGYTDPEDPWYFITVHFNMETFGENNDNDFSELNAKPIHCPKNIRQKIIELSAVWQEKGLAYETKCRAILQDVMTDLVIYNERSRHNPLRYQKIETVQTHIQENIEKHFKIEDLAAMADVSVSYFRQLFKSITGMSVAQYVNFIKINKAKDLLISGEYNVTEVANQTGYSDIFYFSRIFKHHTGHPPSYYLH